MPDNLNNDKNNSFATATSLSLSPTSQQKLGALSAADLTDYYKFTLSSSSSVSISLTDLTGNARIRLFSEATPPGGTPTPTEIGNLGNNPSQLAEYVTKTNLAVGTYYIQIDLDPNQVTTSTTNYTLGAAALGQLGAEVSPFLDWRQEKNLVLLRNQSNADAGFWQMNGVDIASPQARNIPLEWKQIGVGDNGDGKTNIFWLNAITNDLAVWIMNGSTLVDGGILARPSLDWQVAGFADFNNDGKTDVLWRQNGAGNTADTIGIWLLNGTTITDLGVSSNVPKEWKILGVGDFNGDKKSDLLWTNTTTGAVATWIMDGKTRVGADVIATLPTGWKVQGIGDTNGDGRADLFVRNTSSGENGLWLVGANGLSLSGAALLPTVSSAWSVKPLGQSNLNLILPDFDGNGKSDLLWRNTDGTTAIWLLDGLALAGTVAINLPTTWTIEAGGDYNLDRKTDLLLRDQSTGDTAVWLMNGTTIAAAKVIVSKLPAEWQFTGGTPVTITVQPLSISGGTFATAFNIGTLNAEGKYGDTAETTRPDWYRFTLEQTSFFTMSGLPGAPASLGAPGTDLILYKESATPSAAPTAVTYTAGMKLAPGKYYVQISALGPADVNYGLTIKGDPVAVNLVETTEVLNPTKIVLNQRTVDTDPPPASNTISVTSTIKNTGNDPAGAFKVNYYLSRNNVFDASDVKLNTTDIVVSGLGFTNVDNSTTLTRNFTLPNGETDPFWTNDQDYFVITVLDPDNLLKETNETDNTLISVLPVSNTLKVNLRTFSLKVLSSTVAPGGNLQIQYQIENAGNKSLAGLAEVEFWLSADNVIDTSASSADLKLGFDDVTSLPGAKAVPAGSNVSTVRTLNVPLASKAGWSGWSNLNGSQTFYIGTAIGLQDADPSDNLNRGVGIDVASFTINLG